jgi:glycosyltransferase involved in cell wall biosynthesis
MLEQITPLLLTWNEAPNLGRVLERLAWAQRVVVLDSGSDDGTQEIARSFPNVVLLERRFDDHASQWNHGLASDAIQTGWVLALDADYVLPEAFVSELRALLPAADVGGYEAGFRYCIGGRPLSGSLYPPVTVLYRRDGATYVQEGHTQRLRVPGRVSRLQARIDHDDRKPLSRWLASQERYATLEARLLSKTPWNDLRWQDRLRTLVFVAPWLAPLYALIFRGAILDGRAGWHYALQRGVAEAILSMKLVEAVLERKRATDPAE